MAGVNEWNDVPVSATNAVATFTKTGVAGRQHYITGMSISASAAPAAAVQADLREGATDLDSWELPAAAFAPIVVDFARPYKLAAGANAVLTVPALGAGVTGTVKLRGFTRNA